MKKTKKLENFEKDLKTLESYGVKSVPRALAFFRFADNQGKTMSEIAGGGAGSAPYVEVHQAMMALGEGYPHGSNNGPKLVTLKARKGYVGIREITLTARGKRLLERVR